MQPHYIQIRDADGNVTFNVPLPACVDIVQRLRLVDFAVAFNTACEALGELLTVEQVAEVVPPLVAAAGNVIEHVIEKFPRAKASGLN